MFTEKKLVALAALNNAQWCASVCQANKIVSHFTDKAWYALGEVPIFYPNVVTLAAQCCLETVRSITKQIGHSLSIKDSYSALALAPLGFVKLFDAQWLLAPIFIQAKSHYQLVTDAYQLAQWIAVWHHTSSGGPFNFTLLNQASVYFVAVYEGDRIVAGGILNKSEGVVGLTNVFYLPRKATACWLSCLSAAYDIGDGLPVVTYQRGDELTLVETIGFTEIGPLSVWVRS